MFHAVIGVLIFLYFFWRLVWPLRKHPVWGWSALVLIGAGSFKYPLIRWFGGAYFFAPDLPGWVLHFAGFWFGWSLFLLLFLLILEPLRIFRKQVNSRRILIGNMIAVTASAILAGISLAGGIRSPAVRQLELWFPDLPVSADGLRLVVLSDLHAGSTVSRERIAEFVRLANAEKADAMLITGDFMDGTADRTAALLEPLAGLHAALGVWGVPGNHDYFYNYAVWRKILTGYGIRMLENASGRIAGICLAGVSDPAARRFGQPEPDLTKALLNTGGEFTILLAHRPGIAPEAARRGVRLQFSGHTHGGMLPGLKSLVACFNHGFVSGVYQVGGMTLAVSNGTGIWNGLPLRLGARSELLSVTLKKGVPGQNF